MQVFLQRIKALDYELFNMVNGFAGNAILDKPMMILASDYFVPITLASVLVFIWFSEENNDKRISNQLSVFKSLSCMGCASLCVLILNTFFFNSIVFGAQS